jgi:ribose 1,5-bisphosphokinase
LSVSRGTLFLIVGPSGAGKDSLIQAARGALDARFVFPRRVITRPAGDGTEDHVALDGDTFAHHERTGAFALSWQAHGHSYGVPASIGADLAAGRHVVVNVSRAVVEAAKARFKPTRVIEVTAPPHLRAERLRKRGREAGGALDARLARERSVTADVTIVNDGALETAVTAFQSALRG